MKAPSKQKVGLFGLSGNPTHKGHLAAARAAKEVLGLDAVWLMINPHNPLKDPSVYASYEHREHLARLEVTNLAHSESWLQVSDYEKRLRDRKIPNETITMLQYFEHEYPDLEPVWLMGADNLATIHTWGGEWNRILEEYTVAVFSREGNNGAAQNSVTARAYRDEQVPAHELLGAGRGYWSFIDAVAHSASSTEIRKQVLTGQHSEHISEQSREYILQNGLYRPKALQDS